MTPDYALVSAKSIEEARIITDTAKKLNTIGYVTSISDYLPTKNEQEERRTTIKRIENYLQDNKTIKPITSAKLDLLFQQVERLEDNIIELSQLAYIGGQDKLDRKTL